MTAKGLQGLERAGIAHNMSSTANRINESRQHLAPTLANVSCADDLDDVHVAMSAGTNPPDTVAFANSMTISEPLERDGTGRSLWALESGTAPSGDKLEDISDNTFWNKA
ncbi:hypothetical protein M405DRAFT_842587 [Rhizopogon salebrosus TDB-379]|nr:hypothetical protein M405DRAFT_842587 [Rhizopogon salebrosus TDB-379]